MNHANQSNQPSQSKQTSKQNKKSHSLVIEGIVTLVLILGATTVLYLHTSGYRLNKTTDGQNTLDLSKTGMISVKSVPDSASVYLDDKLVTATDDTISGVDPGIHNLKMIKKGFVEWTKDIEVFQGLVTDITAILVSQSPSLEPLTNTGARFPKISPTLTKLAYFSNDSEKPGVWIIPLGGTGINLFKSNPTVAIQDTRFTKYSSGTALEWAPDEKELLVQGDATTSQFYLIDLQTNTAQTTSSPQLVRENWANKETQKRTDFVANLDVPDNIKQLAVSAKSSWAPDNKKFLYTVQQGDNLEYRVYNFEKPLPVGEKVDSVVLKTNVNDPQPKISWYSDSFHLILVDGDIGQSHKGSISLIRIDGTNKVEVYNNTLYSDSVFSAPSGDKIIILTSFKSGDQTDLYTVGIR